MIVPSTLRIAWRNLGRNWRRTGLALAAIVTGQAALLLFASVANGYGDWMVQVITGPLVGHVQVHAPKWRKDRALDRSLPHAAATLAALRRDPGVKGASGRIYAPALAGVELSWLFVGENVTFEGVLMDPRIYTDFGPWLFGQGLVLSLAATLVASVYPAVFAARTDPATALRVAQ